jgi:hypothetical protein
VPGPTKILNNFRSSNQDNFGSKNFEALKIINVIIDLIKSMNRAFGLQVFGTILSLLIFGIIMAFSFLSTGDIKMFPIFRTICVLIYIHYVAFEISYYGHSTHQEVITLHCLIILNIYFI